MAIISKTMNEVYKKICITSDNTTRQIDIHSIIAPIIVAGIDSVKRIVRVAKILFDFSVLNMKSVSLKISIVSLDSSRTSRTFSVWSLHHHNSQSNLLQKIFAFAQFQDNSPHWNNYSSKGCYLSS